MVWLQFDGVAQRTRMVWVEKPAGGTWGAPVPFGTISPVLYRPKFAMNSRGDALLVWLDNVNGNLNTVMVATRASGGAWTAPAMLATLADAGTPFIQPVQALVGESGDALVSWEGYSNRCGRVCVPELHELNVSRLPAGSSAWQHSGKLAKPADGYFRESQILLDASGRAGVVYSYRSPANPVYTYAVRAAVQQGSGQPWSAFTDVASGFTSPRALRAGNDDFGNATIATSDGMSMSGSLASNRWTAPQIVAGLGVTDTYANTFSLSVGRNGAAVIAARTVGVVRPNMASSWGAAGTLAPSTNTGVLALAAEATAITPSGKAVVVYRDWDAAASTYRLYAVSSNDTGTPPLPPPAPTALSAVAASNSQINLSWVDNAGSSAVSQEIERCAQANCSDFRFIANVAAGASSFSDATVSASTSYSYRIRVRAVSDYSAYSPMASATTPAGSNPPAAPSALGTTNVTNNSISLRWADNSNDEDSFQIMRCTMRRCTSFVVIATVPSNTTAYTDANLKSGTLYRYVVRATNAYGTSSSAAISVQTKP